MPNTGRLDTILPHVAPFYGDARTLLFAIRRMAIHGIHDAFATNALIAAYGLRYRKPLLLLRTVLIDTARTARSSVIVAPCCSLRMTTHEFALLSAIAQPAHASNHLAALLDPDRASIAGATIAALSETLESMGRPLTM